jgi:hypothetical protein
MDTSQAYFWASEWQIAEREASADITAGHIHEAANVDNLIAQLKRARWQ